MPWSGIGSAVGAIGGGLVQGLFNQSAASGSKAFQREMWEKNYNAQKEFAQNGVRWKVDDAKAAGLHPLAALSGSGAMFSPSGGTIGAGVDADYSWLERAGQGIGRAIDAKATQEERAQNKAFNDEMMRIKLEQAQADLDYTKTMTMSQVARDAIASNNAIRNQQQVPFMPSLRTRPDGSVAGIIIPGQADSTTSSLFTVKPAELIASHPQTPYAEAGSVADLSFSRTGLGGYSPVRSSAVSQLLEDDYFGNLRFNIRNQLGFLLGDQRFAPPRDFLPDHGRDPRYMWAPDWLNGDWFPYHTGDSRLKALKGVFGFR